jgi:tetratricopeptide (TPR) repeat protein
MLNDLALMLSSSGQYLDSIQVFNEALEIQDNHLPALLNLAGLHSNLDNIQLANELYLKAVNITSSNSAVVMYNYGVLMHKIESLDEAKRMWSRSIELDSDLLIAQMNLASITCQAGNYTESKLLYKNAINASIRNSDINSFWLLIFQYFSGHIPMIISTQEEIVDIRNSYSYNLLNILRYSPRNIMDNPIDYIGIYMYIAYYLF